MYSMGQDETLKYQRLPQLNVGKESPPRRLLIILVQHDDLISTQGTATSGAVRRGRIPPGRPEYNLVANCKAEDEEESNHVFEKVVCRKWSSVLVPV